MDKHRLLQNLQADRIEPMRGEACYPEGGVCLKGVLLFNWYKFLRDDMLFEITIVLVGYVSFGSRKLRWWVSIRG